jgi:hypothetical protein
MNTKQFTKQLRREIKTNPKRAFALAVVCGVGVYFWAPLIMGWISPEPPPASSTKKKASVASAGKAAAKAAASDSADAAAKRAPMAWKDISRAIRNDWRMKPATDLALSRNPFAPKVVPHAEGDPNSADPTQAKPTAEAVAAADVASKAAVADPTPQSLGLKLTGTMIGARKRSAVINGRVVSEGSEYAFDRGRAAPAKTATPAPKTTVNHAPAKANGKPAVPPNRTNTAKSTPSTDTQANAKRAPAIRFQLIRVNPQSVVLERNKKKYELKIDLPQIPDGDVIEFTSASAPPGETSHGGS